MKNVKLELYVDLAQNEVHIIRDMPAYGDVGEMPRGARQNLVLNDGLHRVKIGVFNATLPVERIKELTRFALTAELQLWAH